MVNAHDPHDTDGSQHASHHTLGKTALQATPGDVGASTAAAVLLKARSWNDTGRNCLMNGSFEAWNDLAFNDDYPDGSPYNWGFFWATGTRGKVRRATATTVPNARDEQCITWYPVDAAGSTQNCYTETISVVPGETHTIGVWARCANAGAPVQLRIDAYWDTIANPIPQPFAGNGVNLKPAVNLTTTWQLYQVEYVIPATAAYLVVYYDLLSTSPVAEQWAQIDQAFYDKSSATIWAATNLLLSTWSDPGINMVLNSAFDVWSIGALPYGYSQILDATYPGSFTRNTTVSRTLKNCLLYTKGATVGPTATDDIYCDNTLKKLVNGEYLVSVWVLAASNNAANPLAGIEALIMSATNAAFTTGVAVSSAILIAINATGANEVGAWIKYTARVSASGGPFWKFGLRFTNNPATSQGWYFTQFTAYKAETETLPIPVNGYTGSNATAASTSYAALSPGLEVSFVAPPSGSVMITPFNDCSMSGTAAGCGGYEIRTASGGGGSVVLAADDTRANIFGGAAGRMSASGPRLAVNGLTPGTTYWCRHMGRNGAGTGAATFNVRRIAIEPVAIYG